MLFKRFLIWSSGGPLVRWSQTIYAILKEGIIGNIHVKLLKFGQVVQEEMSFNEKVRKRRTQAGRMHDRRRTKAITIDHIEP